MAESTSLLRTHTPLKRIEGSNPSLSVLCSMESEKFKTPPHSKESEMMVLGCMMTSINSLNVAADLLDDEDFYHTEHKLVFSVLKAAFFQDKPADVHLVAEELKRQDKLKAVGGVAYLTTLVQFAGTSAYIDEYAQLVKDKAILRRMIHAAQEVEKKALKEPDDVSQVLDEAQSMFFSISQSANPLAGKLLRDILVGSKSESQTPFLKEVEKRQERYIEFGPEKGSITGIPTYFYDLDKLINGLNRSNLMILAARPAMGKTALAINMAENVAFRHNLPVGIFSLEMSADQLVHRIVCSQSKVLSDKIKTGALNGEEFQRIVESVNKMQNHTLVIDDQAGLKITDLRARARRMRESYGIEFLVIDYLQLLSGSGASRSQENRQMEISEISRMLKTLARELNIPILCLSQLSRRVEERTGHRPMMSDLRESGCLSGDTLIVDALNGKSYTIKELAERPEQTPIAIQAIDPQNWKSGIYKMTKVFPSGRKRIYALRTRTGKSIKATSNHPFLKLEGWIPLEKLQIGDKIAIPRSLQFKDPDVYWDQIISIEGLGEEDVYDATVPEVHNFLANDIYVHNSIEQDADIVMFLLRREYYDPQDKPGQAELILGKNRHGGVGSIHLAYVKEIARFENLDMQFSKSFQMAEV